MKQKRIIDKKIYGGMLVDKYFLVLDDGTEIQVRFSEWEKYQKGDEYPQPTESETFKKICKELVDQL